MKGWKRTFRAKSGHSGGIFRYVSAAACIALAAVCIIISPAYAHKVNIFAYAQDGKIYAEGYFVDGTKCKNSLVQVIDNKTGEKLLEGYTDGNGQYTFGIPRGTSLKMVLYAGTGHQNEYVLSEEEVRAAMSSSATKTEKEAVQSTSPPPALNPLVTVQPARLQDGTNAPPSPEEMEELIGRVVDSRLQPVMRILVKLQEQSEKPGLTEIIGGIGYIIGIMGLAGYLKGRADRRQNRSS